jgi:hypothetical protein
VLAGSSMGFRLSADFMEGDFLGPRLYNLSFAGKTALPGLDLIIAKPDRPRLVFIEMNTMLRAYDGAFAAVSLREPWFTLRKIAPGFRIANRPLDLAAAYGWRIAKTVLGAAGLAASERIYAPPAGAQPAAGPLDERDRGIVEENMRFLHERIAALKEAGIRVVLVRFPSHPALDTAASSYVWALANATFAPDRYQWLDLRATGSYATDDGIHLTKPSARQAAAVLRGFAERVVVE